MTKNDRIEEIQDEIDDLKDELEDLAFEKTSELSEKAGDYAQMLQKKAKKFYEKGQKAGETINQYGHENPWKVAGMALALGLIIGLLVRPCHHRNRGYD